MFKTFAFILLMCKCFACMYECVTPVYLMPTCQRRALDALKLELQMFLSCGMGARNQTWVQCKSSKCS